MNQSLGELNARQPGMGWGGFVVLSALLVLTAFGIARRGFFKGDLFVSAAVLVCGSLLALFIVFPVLKALSAAFFLEDGPFSLAVATRQGLRCRSPASRGRMARPSSKVHASLGTSTLCTALGR